MRAAVQVEAYDTARENLQTYCAGAFEEERRKVMFGKIGEAHSNRLLDNFFLSPALDGKWRKALISDQKLLNAAVRACRNRVVQISREVEGYLELFKAGGAETETVRLREALRILDAAFPAA